MHNFLSTTHNWIASGGKIVSTEHAAKRSAICVTCPNNRKDGAKGKCGGCFARGAMMAIFGHQTGSGKATRWVPEAIPMSQNPLNGELTYCKACGCNLRIKVFIPLLVIENKGVSYPDLCWQHSEIDANLQDENESSTLL